jgi:hypothetical protein
LEFERGRKGEERREKKKERTPLALTEFHFFTFLEKIERTIFKALTKFQGHPSNFAPRAFFFRPTIRIRDFLES